MEKYKVSKRASLSSRVSLCGENAISIGGQVFVPDKYSAYIEFYLAHALPVITCDQTALHPQVVANSWPSLLNKVFNLGHLMVANDPEHNARDRVLGTIVGVEFPAAPPGGWKVMASRLNAPGIRAVAVVHRQAEGVEDVLRTHFSGKVRWTVSMEQEFFVDRETETIPVDSGFLVKDAPATLDEFRQSTPEDLSQFDWTYVPCAAAPDDLMRCFTVNTTKCEKYRGRQTVLLFGGLEGRVQFKGTALTPLGKESEARVAQMLASGAVFIEDEGADVAGLQSLTNPLTALCRLMVES